uniref:Flavodoxin family protein n=1 Tax=candidate division WOR-3 bacterium TaxID=2052148 RepID=A0A7C4GE14_UNCW3
MKRILVLEGSPRHGNTEIVTDWVLSGLGPKMQITRLRTADLNVAGCRECLECTRSKKQAGCGQEDDMAAIYDLMVDADLIIFTSPVFCWGVTSQLKAVVDRCFALLNGENLLKGSRWALVITAGGDHFDGADLIVQMFSRLARFAGADFLGQYVAANCPERNKLKASRQISAEARKFGRELREKLQD